VTVTLLLSAVMMAGLFLMLYAAVGLIQNKKFFTSAPKDVQAAVQPRGERFPGAHALGWCLMGISFLLMLGALALGGWDGVHNGFGFWRLFGRFLTMLWLLKAFDVLFFDWVLLCHSDFFPHFYPEVKGVVGPHQFGYNWREHLQMILASPVVAAVLAGICMLF
jgi:hypothetical protein